MEVEGPVLITHPRWQSGLACEDEEEWGEGGGEGACVRACMHEMYIDDEATTSC